MTKYVGADVHSATTTFCVLDEKGLECSRMTVLTQPLELVSAIKSIPDEVHLAFEEGTQAAWLYDLLKPKVSKLVVFQPTKKDRKKNDDTDAWKAANGLRNNQLRAVYHGDHGFTVLKDLTRMYQQVVADRTRIKNRLKSVFRARAVAPGDSVYRYPEKWLNKLNRDSLKEHARQHYRQLTLLDELVQSSRVQMVQEARRHAVFKLLRSIPGIGEVRAAVIMSEVRTPGRFPNKRKFWSYVGLAIDTESSADYRVHLNKIIRRPNVRTRGLTNIYNRHLKEVFKGAATTVKKSTFADEYRARLERGQRDNTIKLTFARRIAAISLAVWKKGEPYDPNRTLMRSK